MSVAKNALGVGLGILLAAGALVVVGLGLYWYGVSELDKDANAADAEAAAEPALKTVGQWTWQEDGDYVVARGEVQNVSDSTLRGVQAVVTYYTASGAFITSDTAMARFSSPARRRPSR
jgi:hypothetical protein